MLTEILQALFTRDLGQLKAEIEQYKQETTIWMVDKDIANSAGNLCLHLIGNLNTFIGKELGGSNYVRNRELEFSQKNIPRSVLLPWIEETITTVSETLSKLTEENLQKDYPVNVVNKPMTTEYFLVHLAIHLAYHLGQVNYHRRLLDD